MECSNGAVKIAFDIQADGKRGPGRPNMTWKQLTERDCREWKLSATDPHDRHTWRSGVRSAMCAASQLPRRGPTDVAVAPIVPVKSRYQENIFLTSPGNLCSGTHQKCLNLALLLSTTIYVFLKKQEKINAFAKL